MTTKDRVAWHRDHHDPASRHSWRLRTIRERTAEALGAAARGEVRVASLCAGDRRDLLGVLAALPRSAHPAARKALAAVNGNHVERSDDQQTATPTTTAA